jgi:hypothetical protein
MRLLESIADIILIGLGVPDPGLDRQPAFALALDPVTGQRVQIDTLSLPLNPISDDTGMELAGA